MRFVLEAEWSGYTSAQRRVCHREVVSEQRARRLRKVSVIRFTDGTKLSLRLREAELRERVKPIDQYNSLIRKAEAAGSAEFVV